MSLKCQSINLIDSLFGYRFEFDVGSTYNPGLIQLLTKISFWVALHWGDADYRREHHAVSAWAVVPGWRLETCFRDPMHILYLGTCRDLYSSALGYWVLASKQVIGLWWNHESTATWSFSAIKRGMPCWGEPFFTCWLEPFLFSLPPFESQSEIIQDVYLQ